MVGSRTASMIRQVLLKNGYDVAAFERILDFACGCGRTLNFMSHFVCSSHLYGCDYDSDLIDWCKKNVQIAEFRLNGEIPRTDWPDSFFDFIYSISFFSHLTAADQKRWLREWRRILKGDGLVLVTVHGKGLARPAQVRLKRGFTYTVVGPAFNERVTYQSRGFVKREWGDLFDIVAFEEQGLADHQDVILLGRRGYARRRRLAPPSTNPPELMREYSRRPDLQMEFDESGIGRPKSSWRNLTLLDWAHFYGGKEVPELRHLLLENFYSVARTERI